jgi:hypothetical protein
MFAIRNEARVDSQNPLRTPNNHGSSRLLLYVIQKVEAGLADAEAGRLIPHEAVAQEMRRKWVAGNGR